MKYFILIFFLLPLSVLGQWKYKYKYKSKFENGIHVGMLLGESTSINYTRNIYIGEYSFFSSSIGLGYLFGYAAVLGEPNPFGFQNSGLGIPVSLTYNHSFGNLDQRIRHRISKKCIIKPPKHSLDWFLEAGAGATPAFYKMTSRNGVIGTGYGGGRIQMRIRRSYKENDQIIFLRAGITPYYENKAFRVYSGGSIGVSI